MIRPLQLIRLLQIQFILLRHGLNRPMIGNISPTLRWLSYLNPWSFRRQKPRAESMRLILEKLGPIFVKFGQLLSTRRDLLPDDIANELAKLQDQVPPFPGHQAQAIVEMAYGQPIHECFQNFDQKPLASASIAQVHTATLLTGESVIIKILRPHIANTIRHDMALMKIAAQLATRFWRRGRRLQPLDIIAEFETTINQELDFMREAANASQLRRNFEHSDKMYVPKVYWNYAKKDVLVMERIHGIRISDIPTLVAAGTNLKKLAEYGVEIFFDQVLRDSFFHADMHPGNLFVDVRNPDHPKYIGVDFGIMGSLAPEDQRYLANNLLAFFKRDYRQVAILHIASGWVSPDTRIDQFEGAIRTVCEPIFEKPLKDISFGQLLLRLFQTAQHFQMKIQPQLLLLQKTLLNIEGLGRELYPELNLWNTAQPCLERWMKRQKRLHPILRRHAKDLPMLLEHGLQTPSLLYDILNTIQAKQRSSRQNFSTNRTSPTYLYWIFSNLGSATLIAFIVTILLENIPMTSWAWVLLGTSASCFFISRLRRPS